MKTRKVVATAQRRVRQLYFRKTGLGTPALSEGSLDAVISDTGTGDYLITFNQAFLRAPICMVSIKTSAKVARCVPAVASVQVLTFNQADGTTASDADFELVVTGFDNEDEE